MSYAIKIIPELSEKQKRNFWRKINVKGPDDCWEWTASLNAYGYGQFNIDGGIYMAHRISHVLAHGQYPEDKQHSLHSCDNPKCQNPAHLFAGTHDDNMQDKTQKGRGNQRSGETHHWRGRRHPLSKLTEESVIKIRRIFNAGGVTKSQLARDFNVTPQLIAQVIARSVWKYLEDDTTKIN